MITKNFSPAQLSAAIDFLSFFLVAPELLGEKPLRLIRKILMFFFFMVDILFLVLLILIFITFFATLPLLFYYYSAFYSFVIGNFVEMGLLAFFKHGSYTGFFFLLLPFSPLVLLALSYLPTLITNLLETLANEKKLRLLLIRTGVILFIAGKAVSFVTS